MGSIIGFVGAIIIFLIVSITVYSGSGVVIDQVKKTIEVIKKK
jgi:hypothetical protein